MRLLGKNYLHLFLLVLVGCGAEPDRSGATRTPETPMAEADYAGDEACASCHEELYVSYHRTGMGRSVSRFERATAPEQFDAEGRSPVVVSEAFGYEYQAFVRGDTLFQREVRRDAAGRVIHERVHPADYVVGSGNATRSYLMRENGFVTEMPLTWYVERALWDLSPGYETSNSRFSRPANLECMTCHNGLPTLTPFTQNHYADLPLGITCERCHGPASEHVEARLAGGAGASDELPDLASLDRELQLSVCQQCHLEGISVFKESGDPSTFRPGEPLAAHRSVFARRDKIEDEDAFGIASHGLRLALSACFEESAMTCTTCHDPHQPTAELGPDRFNAVCQSCHGGADEAMAEAMASAPGHETLCARPGAGPAEAMTGDCVSCHMQVGGTSDIPHVSFTDHWIRRRLPPARPPGEIEREPEPDAPFVLVRLLGDDEAAPGEGDLESALAYFHLYETVHTTPAYLPNVVASVRRGLAAGAERADARIALGRALAELDSLAAAESALADALARYPDNAWVAYWLGTVRADRGDAEGAVVALQRAAEIQPLLVEARIALGQSLAALGRTDEALAHLEAAVEADPLHHPAAWNNLGFLHLQAGRVDAATPALTRAVDLDPDFAEARVNLGSAHLMAGRIEPAVAQFEEAVRVRPTYAPAYGNLGVAYAQLGRTGEARRMFERLLELNPGDRRARAYLAELGSG